MKIIVAPNALKGSATAKQAATAIAHRTQQTYPKAEIVEVPVADGGDGLVAVLLDALSGESRTVRIRGPRDEPVSATFCYVPAQALAIIEMAAASGLALLSPAQRDPALTTTYGVGQLIKAALDLNVARIIIGIGGSATNDGGIGMAAALGVRFLDDAGSLAEPVGGEMHAVREIDLTQLDKRIAYTQIDVICDVENPLLGPRGAAAVYGPQKGATPSQVQQLEAGLANLAATIEHDLAINVRTLPGAGAAGGLGAGLHAFLNAQLHKGIDVVFDLIGFENKLLGADLVLTAEGHIDGQTAYGKAPAGVAARAKAHGIPCIALAGRIGDDIETLHAVGFTAIFSLCPGPITLAEAMSNAPEYLAATAEQAIRCFVAGKTSG